MAELKNRTSPEYLAESAVCRYITTKRFFRFFGKRPAIFACKIGSCSCLYVTMQHGYLAIHPRYCSDGAGFLVLSQKELNHLAPMVSAFAAILQETRTLVLKKSRRGGLT